jgi:hypothetical protein
MVCLSYIFIRSINYLPECYFNHFFNIFILFLISNSLLLDDVSWRRESDELLTVNVMMYLLYLLLFLLLLSINCLSLSTHQNGDARNLGDIKPRISEESNDKSKIWKLTEINEPSHCRSLKLPENARVTKVCYLLC